MRTKEVFLYCLKKYRVVFAVCFIILFFNFSVFSLYRIYKEPFIYGAVLTLFTVVFSFLLTFLREIKKSKKRECLLSGITTEWSFLEDGKTPEEKDYAAMIRALGEEMNKITARVDEEKTASEDFYTVWVHQIKTPIAVMKLSLDNCEDFENKKILQNELFRIEQYVDMVLNFMRLSDNTNDLVISEYRLDDIIRETVRKFAPQFIGKKLSLEYTPTDKKIVTDKKWFICILEQFLSNAVKYTSSGGIKIYVKDETLFVCDSGMGIAKEDLPRIFERGYTGLNGRKNEKSSGLGLYIAGKSAKILNLKLSAESSVGKGSAFSVSLSGERNS